ncbi:MAG: amidohydrolase, partial [Brevundimonas sp.]|nr:amidohydrolase [Brevundimonas sp.]
MTHRALLTVAFAAIALPAFAQDLVIRGGTIHTGVEGAAPAEVVIARDGRIAYVGPAAGTPSTEGLDVVELNGATLFPG